MTDPDRPEDGATTSLFVENVDTWEPQSAEDRRLLGDLDAELVRDALVLPIITTGEGRLAGGVVRPDGSRVERGRHLQHAEQVDHPANVVDVYSPAEAPARHHGRVIYAGGGGKFGAFGHFLIEDLSRLWCLFENPEYRDLPLVFINPQQKIDSAGFRLLELAGISAEQVLILDRPTVFDEVIVPDQSLFLHPGSLHAAKSRITYDAIRDSVAPGPYEKVYFTYTQMKRTQLSVSVNEEMIEDLYRRNGFEIIAPETLSIREQIGIIAGAREIACTAGTLSHLVAFARDGVVLDIFVRDKNFMPEIQWSLDQLRSAQVSIVDTLRPLLWGNARRGVIYFTPTPQWARFARARFDAIEPSESPNDYTAKYLAEWALLLGNSRKWALDLMPEWRASDLVESLYLALLPAEELPPDQRAGLRRRFYAPERRLEEAERRVVDLQQRLHASARRVDHLESTSAEDAAAHDRLMARAEKRVSQLERQLTQLKSSRSWRVTRPLRRLGRRPRSTKRSTEN